ncbi:MAG: hypothetical protein WC044_00645 [Crocinitomicaceae bacterium]
MKTSFLSFAGILLIHVLAYFVIDTFQPKINHSFLIKEIGYSTFVLCAGLAIMFVKFKKGEFVARFMIITVFQMLAILSFLLALVYLKIKPLQSSALNLIAIYAAGMVLQTLIFLRFSKKTS